MHMVNGLVSINVGMGGMVGGEVESAERTTLVEVEHFNALRGHGEEQVQYSRYKQCMKAHSTNCTSL